MNYISETYLAFFAGVFLTYWLINSSFFKKVLLLVASFIFYSWGHPWMSLVLSGYIIFNFLIASQLEGKQRKFYYWAGVLIDIGGLLFFKYFGFLRAGVLTIIEPSGILANSTGSNSLFPLGISFFTLQLVSYLTDVHRGQLKHRKNLLDFSMYVSFFPKLIAGPIERGKKLIPQIVSLNSWSWDRFNEGWGLIILGYLYKVVIADNVAAIADKVFVLQKPTLFLLGAGALAFTLQIYADFSSYTHLARGFSKLLGFDLTENFNSPYLALTPSGFWERWHISFSSWLRDYVFFPIRRLTINLSLPEGVKVFMPAMAAMLFSGFWHGVGWTFIIWGAYYGVLISIYQLLQIDSRLLTANRLIKFIAWAINFSLVVFGWIIFRSPSLTWFLNALHNPVYGRYQESLVAGSAILILTAFYTTPMILKRWASKLSLTFPILEPVYYALALTAITIFVGSSSQEFIYFNF